MVDRPRTTAERWNGRAAGEPITTQLAEMTRERDDADEDTIKQHACYESAKSLMESAKARALAAEATVDRYKGALTAIADSGCSTALGGGKPTCIEAIPGANWDWCTRCVARFALTGNDGPVAT